MRAVITTILTLFITLNGFAQTQENNFKTRTIKVTATNPKGKLLKDIPLYYYLNNDYENLISVNTDKSGIFFVNNVRDNDTLNLIINKYIYSINLHDYESLNIVMKNKRTFNGYSKDVKDKTINTGYNKTPLSSNVNAATAVDVKEIDKYVDIESYMRGRVAGVDVRNGRVAIRGVGSINSGTEVLIVVDNVYMSFNDLNSMYSPRDIESITVLKDGSMYGFRGVNGVIVVTTKNR